MPALRCIVVDDEPLAVKLLADYVLRTPHLECVSATTDVMLALRLVQEGAADLVFLDIQMPELSGIQFMKIIRNSCSVIITSAYTQYAIDGFEHDVTDYLLKPVTYDRFMTAVNKVVARTTPAALPAAAVIPDHIFIKTSNKLQRVDLADILYIEALRDYIAIHLPKQKILSLESMKNILTVLPVDRFARIHKSYIVNKSKISFLERSGVNINGVLLPVGDTYRSDFMAGITRN